MTDLSPTVVSEMDGEALSHYDAHKIEALAGTVLRCRTGMNDPYEWSPEHTSVQALFHFDLDEAISPSRRSPD